MADQPRTNEWLKERKMGKRLMVLANSLVMAGAALFIYGAIAASNAIL
jgi:hypothetical protein